MIITTIEMIDQNGRTISRWMTQNKKRAIERAQDDLDDLAMFDSMTEEGRESLTQDSYFYWKNNQEVKEAILIEDMTYDTIQKKTRYKGREIARWKKENKDFIQLT